MTHNLITIDAGSIQLLKIRRKRKVGKEFGLVQLLG